MSGAIQTVLDLPPLDSLTSIAPPARSTSAHLSPQHSPRRRPQDHMSLIMHPGSRAIHSLPLGPRAASASATSDATSERLGTRTQGLSLAIPPGGT